LAEIAAKLESYTPTTQDILGRPLYTHSTVHKRYPPKLLLLCKVFLCANVVFLKGKTNGA
jgi:hypothetical protein